MKSIEGGLPQFVRIVQSEQNIERWCNFIFPPAKALEINQIRTHEWEDTVSDDYKIKAKITILPEVKTKGFTTTTHDVMLTLMELWRERGMPRGKIQCQVSDLLKRLGNTTGGRSIEKLVNQMRVLHRSTIEWEFSFLNPSAKYPVEVPEMHILSSLAYQGTVKAEKIYVVDPDSAENPIFNDKKACVTFSLNENIWESLVNSKTIPVDLTTRRSIKSHKAKCYYGRIDNILCGRQRQYSRTGTNLVNDLQMMNIKRYKYKSYRQELCIDLVKALNGIQLSNGSRLKAWDEETKDGEDWKVNFKAQVTGQTKQSREAKNTDDATIDHLIVCMQAVTGEKDTNNGLYKLFAQQFSETMIHRAIGTFRHDIDQQKVKNKGAYFTTLLHQICHDMGGKWINDCPAHCEFRPENRTKEQK